MSEQLTMEEQFKLAENDLDEDAEVLLREERRDAYEAKVEGKRERLAAAADKARARSASAQAEADRIANGIPFGQPVLIGHSSEKRHRRDLDKIHRNTGKSIEEAKLASELEHRAENYGTHGISSDNPDAPDMLKEKLENLKLERDKMKKTNALYRKGGWSAIAKAGLINPETTPEKLAKLEAATQATWEKRPYAPYELTNLGANIRRIEQRIKDLGKEEEVKAANADKPITGDGFAIEEDALSNRMLFRFDAKPPENIRSIMKSNGWRWAPSVGAYSRLLNQATRYAAGRTVTEIETARRNAKA
jgi:hypothetical protein